MNPCQLPEGQPIVQAGAWSLWLLNEHENSPAALRLVSDIQELLPHVVSRLNDRWPLPEGVTAHIEDDMDVADPARVSHWERKSLPGINGPMRAPQGTGQDGSRETRIQPDVTQLRRKGTARAA